MNSNEAPTTGTDDVDSLGPSAFLPRYRIWGSGPADEEVFQALGLTRYLIRTHVRPEPPLPPNRSRRDR